MVAHEKVDGLRALQLRVENALKALARWRPAVDDVSEKDEDGAGSPDRGEHALHSVEVSVDVPHEDRAGARLQSHESLLPIEQSALRHVPSRGDAWNEATVPARGAPVDAVPLTMDPFRCTVLSP